MFTASVPDELWLADIAYCSTTAGCMWRLSSMCTPESSLAGRSPGGHLQCVEHEIGAHADWLHKFLDSRSTSPESSSWMNLVERCFAELTNRMLKRPAHKSNAALTLT